MTPLSQGFQKGTCWEESLSLSGPGPPQFSHFQGSDSSLKTKYDPSMVSQALTLQPGHQVKALPQRQDPTLGICISMGSGTFHSFLDPYPLVRSCHTSTELPLPQSSLVPTPPPLSRDPCPKSDPSVRVRTPNPTIGILHSGSRNSHPRSEDPRPCRTRSGSGPTARAGTHLGLAYSPWRRRQRGGQPGFRSPAVMAATAVRVKAWAAGGRFWWRTPVVAGGVRGAAQDAAGRVWCGQEYARMGVGTGCPSGRCPCVGSLSWDRTPPASSHPQSPFQMEKQLGDYRARGSAG